MADLADHQVEFWIFAAMFGLVTVMGFAAARWRRPATGFYTLDEWGLGGRAFGNWVTWFLLVLALYTFNSGLRAPALLSIVKDALVLWMVIAIVLVVMTAGGWSVIFDSGAEAFAASPREDDGLLLGSDSQLNYVTLALGSALALFLYPHTLTAVLAARNRATLRRTVAALPLYTLLLGILMMAGFAVIHTGVEPVDGDPNTVLPAWFDAQFPAWSAGLMFAAIGVGALVPAAIMSIAAANLFTRTIYRGYLRPNASPKEETTVSKIVSLTVKIGAVLVILLLDTQFAIDLQLIGGVFIMQTLPAVAIGLYTAWLHRWALVAGVVTGIATGLVMLYQVPRYGGPDGTTVVREHFGGSAWPLSNLGLETRSTIYVGVVALAVNLIVAVLLTPLMRGVARDGTDVTHPADYVADEGDSKLQRMSELVDGTPDGDDDQRRIDVPPRRTPSTYVPRRSAGPPRPYR